MDFYCSYLINVYMTMKFSSQIFNIPLFSREVTNFFVDLVEETIRIREEKGIVRPDMITLLLEARQGDQKHEENTSVETGFATVEELNVQTGKTQTNRHLWTNVLQINCSL